VAVDADGGVANICVRVNVPEASATNPLLLGRTSSAGSPREGVDIACVIDTSGSMDTEVTREDDDGNLIREGLSILDIVKHAVKTVITILEAGDRLTLVGFHRESYCSFPLAPMNEEGKAAAIAALEGMRASSTTNIWVCLSCPSCSLCSSCSSCSSS